MELYFLDDSFNYSVGPIDDYLSLIWVDRFQEPGDCSLTLSPDLVKDAISAAYIYNSERGVMEITGISYSAVGHRSLTVTGAGLVGMLNRRVITSNSSPNPISRQVGTIIKNHVANEISGSRALPLSVIYDVSAASESVAEPYNKWENLLDFVLRLISSTSYGIKMDLVRNSSGIPSSLKLTAYAGKNRTQSQNVNSRAIFSQSFGNIKNIEIRKNSMDYKNLCYAYSGEDLRYTYDATEGNQRREIAISADAESYNDAMLSMCREAMAAYTNVDAFYAEADQSDLIYKSDYDLGDLCDISDDTTGITTQARITSVSTVYEKGVVKVTPTFGESTLSLRKFIKRSSGATYNITINETPEET